MYNKTNLGYYMHERVYKLQAVFGLNLWIMEENKFRQ